MENVKSLKNLVTLKSSPYLIWACAALFYLYQFILRVSPSVMLHDLMGFFQITASEVGALSAVALYSYALLQIPSGILADIFGVRKVILISLSLCILGTLIFISTDNLLLAKFGRLLLGAGSASAFLCVSKVAALWFSPKRRAFLFGMTMAAGTIGALNGSTPLAILITHIGWRQSLAIVAFMGCLVLALVVAFLKDPPQTSPKEQTFKTHIHDNFLNKYPHKYLGPLRTIVKSRICWLIAMTALGAYLTISVIADLWGVSFLMQTYGFSKQQAARTISLMYVGLCTGSLSLTFISDFIQNRKTMTALSIITLLLALCMIVYLPGLSLTSLSILFFIMGFFSGAEMLCFASASESVPIAYAGTVTGFINCVVMLGGALVQEQVGLILDYSWNGNINNDGIRLYTLHEYQYAFGLIAFVIFISALTSLFLPSRHRSS